MVCCMNGRKHSLNSICTNILTFSHWIIRDGQALIRIFIRSKLVTFTG
jgi:hypothetical protein